MMTKALLAAMAAILVSFCCGATASSATGVQTFDVYAAGEPFPPRSVAASGPISGVGTVVTGSEVDGPDGTRIATTTWIFREGSVFVTLTFRSDSSFDQRSCVHSASFRGTWRITGGTGRYAGATGSGTVSGTISDYSTRTASGCSSNLYLHVVRLRYWGIATVR